jgi:hypothetical protein
MRISIPFTIQSLWIILFTMSFFLANGQNINVWLPEPIVNSGIAKVSGSINNLSDEKKKVMIAIFVNNPITGESKYETAIKEDNRFSVEIPLECTTSICFFRLGTDTKTYGYGSIGWEQDKVLQLNFFFNDKGNIEIDAKGGFNLAHDDMVNITEALGRFEDYDTRGDFYKMTPEEFAAHELTISLKERTNAALDSLVISENIKNFLIDQFNLRYLTGRLFHYKEAAENSFKSLVNVIEYKAEEPGKKYYSFLSQFDLNNPQYLYCPSYSKFMRRFLTIEAFRIPAIKDVPPEIWLKEVKASLEDVIGFNSGLFYDMLVANAYALQKNDRKEPLTKKQIENITNYFKDNKEEFSKILIKKNE